MHKQENVEGEIEKKIERIEKGNFKKTLNTKKKNLNKNPLFVLGKTSLGVTRSSGVTPSHIINAAAGKF